MPSFSVSLSFFSASSFFRLNSQSHEVDGPCDFYLLSISLFWVILTVHILKGKVLSRFLLVKLRTATEILTMRILLSPVSKQLSFSLLTPGQYKTRQSMQLTTAWYWVLYRWIGRWTKWRRHKPMSSSKNLKLEYSLHSAQNKGFLLASKWKCLHCLLQRDWSKKGWIWMHILHWFYMKSLARPCKQSIGHIQLLILTLRAISGLVHAS